MTLSILRCTDEQLHLGTVRVEGSFRFDTTTDPSDTAGYVLGRGISNVAHTSTGVWTVTLDDELLNSQGLICAQVTLELDASALTNLELGAFDAAAGTQIVRAYTEAAGTTALADIAAGSNRGNWCHLTWVLKFSTAQDGSGLV